MTTDLRETSPTPEEPKEEETHRITLVVHVSSRDSFKVRMGAGTTETIQQIHNIINNSMNTVRVGNDLTLVSEDAVVHHFNVDHVVCVEVKVE